MKRLLSIFVVVGALALLPAAGALAQETLTIQVAKKAALVDGGRAVAVTVTVTCPSGSEVLEAFVYVVQDESQSLFAPLQVTCDGTTHTQTVEVPAGATPFHAGSARVSGYILLTSGAAVSPTATIKIRK